MKNRGWIIFGIFMIAAIVAFAIYKASTTTNTTITTSGGSETKATAGIGEIIGGFKDIFSGFGNNSTVPKVQTTGLAT